MAAGIVYHDITTSSGETFTVGSWVPDTGSPDANAIPVHMVFDATGVEVWTAAKITTMLGYLDGVETLLTAIDGHVDGLEALLSGTLTVASHAVTNAGTFAVQVDGAALTSLQLIDDTVFVDDAAFTPGTSKVLAVGLQADETATDSVDEGDIGAPRMTLDRKLITTPQPHTAGGLSINRNLDVDESEDNIKTSPGCLYKLRITNFSTSARYVKLYNDTAANITVGSSTPLDTIPVPPAAASGNPTVITENFGGLGLTFDTALCIAATTALADADTGAPSANDVVVSAYYK